MSNYRSGDVIRLTRIAKGLSQERLSEGICSVQTLHRIENGKTRIKKEIYQRLMLKMERIPEMNYAICVGKDIVLMEEKTKFEDAIAGYDYEEATILIKKIKEEADNNIITKQYVLKAEALLDYYKKEIDENILIERLTEAISLTIPDYEECLNRKYPLTEQEIMNIMSIANAFLHMGKLDKAIRLYEKLVELLDMDYIMGANVDHMKIILIRNIAYAHSEKKEYKEAIELCNKCMILIKENNEGKLASIILSDIAYNMLRQIEIKERKSADIKLAKEYIKQSYYISMARGDKKVAQIAKNAYKKEFEENLG